MQVRHEMNDKIRRMRPTFYFLGLLISLSATLAAFRWETTHETVKLSLEEEIDTVSNYQLGEIKIIEEQQLIKTTKTKLVAPDPNLFKITDKNIIVDTGYKEKVVVNPFIPGGDKTAKPDSGLGGPEDFGNEIIDVPGSFPYYNGGDAEWSNFINKNLIIPGIVYESNQSSINIVIKCVVEKDGSLTNFSIAKDGGSAEAAEAFIKTLQKSPKWMPGTQNMRPVRVYVYIPLKIKLNNNYY